MLEGTFVESLSQDKDYVVTNDVVGLRKSFFRKLSYILHALDLQYPGPHQ